MILSPTSLLPRDTQAPKTRVSLQCTNQLAGDDSPLAMLTIPYVSRARPNTLAMKFELCHAASIE